MKTEPTDDRLTAALCLALRELRDAAVAAHNVIRLLPDERTYLHAAMLTSIQAFTSKLRADIQELSR